MINHGGDVYNNEIEYDFSVNLSPYGVPEAVREALNRSINYVNQYPDIRYTKLRKVISDYENGYTPESIICGNGASELIYAAVAAIINYLKKDYVSVGLLVPCFSEYEDASNRCQNALVNKIQLYEENDFLPTESDINKLSEQDLIIIGQPNNPTGRLIDEALLKKLVLQAESNNSYVVIDESFIELSDYIITAADISKNVIRIKSFTKSMAIPGVRIGYAVCNNSFIRETIIDLLPEWNVSIMAEYAGIAAIKALPQLREQIENPNTSLMAEREFMIRELTDLGVKAFPSDTCFILIKYEQNLYKELLKYKILIRECSDFSGLDDRYFRIAVKSHAENLILLDALNLILQEYKNQGSSNILSVRPDEIEGLSFSILTDELSKRGIKIEGDTAMVIKRCIHTTADFEYVNTLKFSENAICRIKEMIRHGATIITDTNMALAGINKTELAKYGCKVFCFMADPLIAKQAKEKGITRASMSMEYASMLEGEKIFVVGNAPTALISLCELMDRIGFRPGFVIGVPVGFVNVVQAKEMIMERPLDYIVNKGRKGGSNVAAAIVNAILYELRKENS